MIPGACPAFQKAVQPPALFVVYGYLEHGTMFSQQDFCEVSLMQRICCHLLILLTANHQPHNGI